MTDMAKNKIICFHTPSSEYDQCDIDRVERFGRQVLTRQIMATVLIYAFDALVVSHSD